VAIPTTVKTKPKHPARRLVGKGSKKTWSRGREERDTSQSTCPVAEQRYLLRKGAAVAPHLGKTGAERKPDQGQEHDEAPGPRVGKDPERANWQKRHIPGEATHSSAGVSQVVETTETKQGEWLKANTANFWGDPECSRAEKPAPEKAQELTK